MNIAETLSQYYERLPFANPQRLSENNGGPGHFNVFSRGESKTNAPFNRRDFYKISLILSTGQLYYADRTITIDRPALMISSPLIPYSWEPDTIKQEGWFCIFSEKFIPSSDFKNFIKESPLFSKGGEHLFFVESDHQYLLTTIFKNMMTEISSDYPMKYDLLRNYLYILIHEALKLRPPQNYKKPFGASQRTTSLFFELLERQFPLTGDNTILKLRTARDYADALSVNQDHLNHILKANTGKTTTQHITLRIIKEAYFLLENKDRSINQIAFALGFEEPSYFSNFFRKNTNVTPSFVRRSAL